MRRVYKKYKLKGIDGVFDPLKEARAKDLKPLNDQI